VIISKIYDFTVGVLELKVNTGQSPTRDIEIIVACLGVIEKHLRVVSLYGYLLDDNVVVEIRDGVIASQRRAR
jgi:hypothetical protein